jgi:hypothetical protein
VAAKKAALAYAAMACDRQEFEVQRADVERLLNLVATNASAALDALGAIPFCASEAATGQAMVRLLAEIERLIPG